MGLGKLANEEDIKKLKRQRELLNMNKSQREEALATWRVEDEITARRKRRLMTIKRHGKRPQRIARSYLMNNGKKKSGA